MEAEIKSGIYHDSISLSSSSLLGLQEQLIITKNAYKSVCKI